MSPLMNPLEYEIHIYWQGAMMKRVAVKIGDGPERELGWPITRVKREAVAHELPTVTVQLIGRLVEHLEDAQSTEGSAV
jgi:hypothetical protein